MSSLSKSGGEFKQGVSTEGRAVLKSALTALEPFKDLNTSMPLQYVSTFLLVATEEHLTVIEYAERANISQSLMSRHLSDLGTTNRYHEAGFGLVESYENVMDRRYKRVNLTHRGKGIAMQIIRALNK
jgi:DNA-binding MarR family transcriptional regulator